MAEPRGVLAETEMPDFSIMGLLLGGSGYASGWFQSRDRLRIADAMAQKTRRENADFAQGVLSSPDIDAMIKNPYDRRANFKAWSVFAGGPADFVQTGNQMLTQGLSGATQREFAGLQHDYQSQEQAQAHQFRLDEQTHGVDEQLRLDQAQQQQKFKLMQEGMKFLTTPPDGSASPEQQQMVDNYAAAQAGYKLQDGYDVIRGPNGQMVGQVPSRGTPERTKIELTGNAYSNVADLSNKLLWQLENDPGNIDVDTWNADINNAANDMRRIYEAGAMTAEDKDFYLNDLLPQLTAKERIITADALGQKRDKLRAVNERFTRDLHQYVKSTVVPIETYTADDWAPPANWKPTKPPPPQTAVRDKNDERLKELRNQPATAPRGRGGQAMDQPTGSGARSRSGNPM